MNINDLTIGEAKQLAELFQKKENNLDNFQIGKKVIIRTYSAGVWFGTLLEKSGNEVVLKDARRMWRWWTKESISLSAVANFGINQDKSKIAPAVSLVWIKAIEIIPATQESIKS